MPGSFAASAAHAVATTPNQASRVEIFEMKFRNPLLSFAITAAFAFSGAAFAESPHFVGDAPTSIDGTGNLTIKWKEAGLGSNTVVNYEARAFAIAHYQCVNRGNKCPKASNKKDVQGPLVEPGSFSSGKNGAINGSLTISPPEVAPFCPSGQHEVLASVDYTGIEIADVSNGVTEPGTPPALGASWYECP